MEKGSKLKVRFPNDNCYFDFDIEKLSDFKVKTELEDSLFGWWGDVYIEVLKLKTENGYINPFDKEIEIDGFIVKYSIKRKEHSTGVLFNLTIEDILVGDKSFKESLNNNFNTYKSRFKRRVIELVEEKHPETKHFLSITGGLVGYYE